MKKTALSLALIGAVALVTACGGEGAEEAGSVPASTPSLEDVTKTVKTTANEAAAAAEATADAATEAAGDVANADLQTLTFSVSGMS